MTTGITRKYATTAAITTITVCALAWGAATAGWLETAKDALGTASQGSGQKHALGASEVAAGLKEALTVGSGRVVDQLGAADGFLKDPKIHIPLPAGLGKVKEALERTGMSGMLDDLEVRLNRAAEAATPEAKKLFLDAIKDLNIDDAMKIYNGTDDACTRYFQGKMQSPLLRAMQPIVEEKLRMAGTIVSYNAVMSKYNSLPFVPNAEVDLTAHVLDRAIAGIFHYLAEEEAAIRKQPAKRTSALLQKVFGAKQD